MEGGGAGHTDVDPRQEQSAPPPAGTPSPQQQQEGTGSERSQPAGINKGSSEGERLPHLDSQQAAASGSGPDHEPSSESGNVSSKEPSAWEALLQRIREVGQLCSTALVQSFGMLDRWYVRLAAVIAFVLALISTVINMVLVPIVNYQMMPNWQQVASQATQRQVCACAGMAHNREGEQCLRLMSSPGIGQCRLLDLCVSNKLWLMRRKGESKSKVPV